MPKYPYRDLGTGFDRNFRNYLNANFDDIESDFKEADSRMTQIENDSIQRDNDLDARIDNIIAQSGTSDTEVVDARYDSRTSTTHPTLKDRLDAHSNEIGILKKSVGVSIEQFPRLNGETDDIPRINRAIEYAFNNGYGEVILPSGTYEVAPKGLTKFIDLKSNITIKGHGSSTILRVKDNTGDYSRIFSSSSRVTNVKLLDFKVDQNPTGNQTCDIESGGNVSKVQYVIALFDFDNVHIDNIVIDKATGVNTIILNGKNCKNAKVTNCYIYFKRGRSVTMPEYDNSAIYFNCENHIAYGNTIVTDIGEKAFGGIETHNGKSVISNNVFENYWTGVNIVNQSSSDPFKRNSSDIVVLGNTINNCVHGIRFWSITGSSLKNVVVSNNVISVAQITHDVNSCSGISAAARAVDNTLEGTLENVTISNNTILFEEEPPQGRTGLIDNRHYGIGLEQVGPVYHVNIVNNILRNAPTKGIAIGCWTSKSNETRWVKVSNNTIIDAGQNVEANKYYRASIFVGNVVRDIQIVDNTIVDTGDVNCKGYQSFWARPSNIAENVVIKRNTVTTKKRGLYPSIDKTKIDTDIYEPSVKMVDSFPPTQGTFEKDDIVYVKGTVTDGKTPVGYKVTVRGSYGTITGVTGSVTAGSNIITVTEGDISTLKVGEIVLVAGSNAARRITYIKDNIIETDGNYGVTVTGSLTYYNPIMKQFGTAGKQAAIPDTSGATLTDLETEVNKLKQALRDYGVIS